MNKQEKAELLHNAIGDIDEELILEAESPKKTLGYMDFLKPLSVCAAVFLLAFVSSFMVKNFDVGNNGLGNDGGIFGDANNGNSNNAVPPNDAGTSSTDNRVLYTAGATLEILDRAEGSYLFKLVITEKQEEIQVTVKGEGLSEHSEPTSYISTTAPYAVLTETPTAPPKILVNGVSAEAIPTDVGEYEITVDLTELDPSVSWRNYFTVSPFGNIFR